MFNQGGIRNDVGVTPNQILMFPQHCVRVGVVVNQIAGATVGSKKIAKAGTPLTGDLLARTTPFTSANADGTDVIGVLEHDVDVTAGNANGTLVIFGFVNKNRMESDVQALMVDAVVKALHGKVYVLND